VPSGPITEHLAADVHPVYLQNSGTSIVTDQTWLVDGLLAEREIAQMGFHSLGHGTLEGHLDILQLHNGPPRIRTESQRLAVKHVHDVSGDHALGDRRSDE